jgi:signal peptidase I
MSFGWIIFILGTIGFHIGLYGMFNKAGITPWKALVPYYNTWEMVEKMELKKYWFWLQFIPIAGQFVSIWIYIRFVEHFGRFSVLHHAAAVIIPFIYFPYLGFSKNERYAGLRVVKDNRKSSTREWIDAAVFAVVPQQSSGLLFLSIPYQRPMEKTLLETIFRQQIKLWSKAPNTLSFPLYIIPFPF